MGTGLVDMENSRIWEHKAVRKAGPGFGLWRMLLILSFYHPEEGGHIPDRIVNMCRGDESDEQHSEQLRRIEAAGLWTRERDGWRLSKWAEMYAEAQQIKKQIAFEARAYFVKEFFDQLPTL